MWKNQGSWNFFHTKLIPNSSINMSDGQPCLTNIYVDEHNSTAKYQATHQFDFTAFDDEGDFSLYRYRRHFPMLLRMGNYEAFGE